MVARRHAERPIPDADLRLLSVQIAPPTIPHAQNKRKKRAHRQGRAYVPIISAVLGCSVLLICVVHFFLIPAMAAAHGATPAGRKVLAWNSWLVLIVVLFVLLVLLSVSFRVSRIFFRPESPRIRTNYPDAWAESGRRFQLPAETDADDASGE